jgi:hypothetical protein
MAEISRRQVLMSTVAVLGGAAAAVLLAGIRPARAWTTYEVPTNRGIGLAYANRCGGAQEHTALKAELQRKLESDPSANSETANCPICGCAVTVSR